MSPSLSSLYLTFLYNYMVKIQEVGMCPHPESMLEH